LCIIIKHFPIVKFIQDRGITTNNDVLLSLVLKIST
jgi:hypothetical protein